VIDHAANRIPTPNAFADQVYTLRTHVNVVRAALLRRFGMMTLDAVVADAPAPVRDG
jgi:hypothetical protein